MKDLIELSKNPDKELFKEELYNIFVESNYNLKVFKDISYKTDYNSSELKQFVIDYVITKFKIKESDFEKFRTENREKNKEIFIGNTNDILEKLGIVTNYLYKNEEEKEIFLRGLYDLVLGNGFDMNNCKEISKKYKITTLKLFSLLKEYIYNSLNKTDDDLTNEERFIVNYTNGDATRLCNKGLLSVYRSIIEAKSVSEVDKIIKESGYQNSYVKKNYALYEKFYKKTDIKKFYYHINSYLKKIEEAKKNYFENYKTEKRKEKLFELKEEASSFVFNYLNDSTYTLDELLISKDLTKETFFDYLDSIKINNKELYDKYINSKEEKEKQAEKRKENIRKRFEKEIHDGYEENGIHREFDILDYLNITNIPVTRMHLFGFDKLNKETKDYLSRFRIFYKYVDKDNSADIKEIMEKPRLVSFEKDKKGNVILESEVYLSDEERDKLIKIIRENGLALNRFTFGVIFKRYINGFVDINESKKLFLNNK